MDQAQCARLECLHTPPASSLTRLTYHQERYTYHVGKGRGCCMKRLRQVSSKLRSVCRIKDKMQAIAINGLAVVQSSHRRRLRNNAKHINDKIHATHDLRQFVPTSVKWKFRLKYPHSNIYRLMFLVFMILHLSFCARYCK